MSTVAPLRLHLLLPIRDLRRAIWRRLSWVDREMCRCAMSRKRLPNHATKILYAVLGDNRIEIAKWVYANANVRLTDAHFGRAAANHNFARWLLQNPECIARTHLDLQLLESHAAYLGEIKTLKEFHAAGRMRCENIYFRYAVRCGYEEILKWLVEIDYRPCKDDLEHAQRKCTRCLVGYYTCGCTLSKFKY